MNVSSDVATIPGWYGKLPTLGDFASRRLEPDFIEPWDLWLAHAMQAQRSTLGEGWLEAYLDTPPWRFVLAPGAMAGPAPELAFAGVLLPSVDRVGRHFPLTIAASLPRAPAVAAEFEALLAWLQRLQDTALGAVQGQWSIDDLEAALSQMPPPDGHVEASVDRLDAARHGVATALATGGGFVDVSAVASRAEMASVFARPSSVDAGASFSPMPVLHGVALWIADAATVPQLVISTGLPGAEAFTRMFSGGGSVVPADLHDQDATLPQPLDMPTVPALQYIPDETDLLGLFQSPDVEPSTLQPAHAGGTDADILAMFGADPTTPLESAAAPATSEVAETDLLGLFDGLATAPHADAAPADPARPKEPDILDLFGGPPAEPDPGKIH